MEIRVRITKLKNSAKIIGSIGTDVEKINADLEKIITQNTSIGESEALHEVREKLALVLEDLSKDRKTIESMNNSLTKIRSCYERTEITLCGGKKSKAFSHHLTSYSSGGGGGHSFGSGAEKGFSVGGFLDDVADHYAGDYIEKRVVPAFENAAEALEKESEEAMKVISTDGDDILENTPESISLFNKSRQFSTIGKALKFAPFIGIAFDTYSMVKDGDSVPNALIKAGMHAATDEVIVTLGTKGGAALGGLAGTIEVPGIGTVSGAAVGGVGGTIAGIAISNKINDGFDTLYDEHVADDVDEFFDDPFDFIKQVDLKAIMV